MKSDRTRSSVVAPPKSTVDENSVSSLISNGTSSNSNSGATTVGEDLSNGNSSVIGDAGIAVSLPPSSLIASAVSGVTGLTSLVLETAGLALGIPQPAHQASNIILTRAVSSCFLLYIYLYNRIFPHLYSVCLGLVTIEQN